MKRFLIILISVFIFFVGGLSLFPGLWINTATAKLVLRILGVPITFKSLDLKTRGVLWKPLETSVQIKDFCLSQERFKACGSFSSFNVAWTIKEWKPTILSLKSVSVHLDHLALKRPLESHQEKSSSTVSDFIQKVSDMQVEVSAFSLSSDALAIKGPVTLAIDKRHQVQISSLKLCGENSELTGCLKNIRLRLDPPYNLLGVREINVLSEHLKISRTQRIQLGIHYQDQRKGTFVMGAEKGRGTTAHLEGIIGRNFHFVRGMFYGRHPKLSFHGQIRGAFFKQQWNYFLKTNVLSPVGHFDWITQGQVNSRDVTGTLAGVGESVDHRAQLLIQDRCRYSINKEEGIQLSCPLAVKVKGLHQQWALGERVLPQVWPFRLNVKGRGPLSQLNQIQLNLSFVPFKTKLIGVQGGLQLRLENFKDVSLKNLKLNSDVRVQLFDFAQFCRVTKGSPLEPPSPFNTMAGEVGLTIRGTIDTVRNGIPFTIQARLKDQIQRFTTQVQGEISRVYKDGAWKPFLKGRVLLSDIKLVLPQIRVGKMPRVFSDKRIKTPEKFFQTGDTKSPLLYFVEVSTGNKPAEFVSNMAQKPLPVQTHLFLEDSRPPRGQIQVLEFPVELFRRKAIVNFLRIKLHSVNQEEVQGQVTIPLADYTIRVLVSGAFKEPIIKFESDPPLSENQIISAVLFGKTPKALDVDETSSVSSMQAAVADRALALTSFFFLASTPVETIGYDAQQKTFLAKIKIQEGMSLDVGSDLSELKELGLNKRLGHSWYIHAYLTSPTSEEQKSATAFLEKVFRY